MSEEPKGEVSFWNFSGPISCLGTYLKVFLSLQTLPPTYDLDQ